MNCHLCESTIPKGKTKCLKCGAWNVVAQSSLDPSAQGDGTVLLDDVDEKKIKVYQTGPWDRNFANPPGVPDDAVILIGGAPGVGKSTMALQLYDALATSQEREALYIPAEEGDTQVLSRAIRLKLKSLGKRRLRIISRNRIASTSIEEMIAKYNPCGVIVDSMPGFTDDIKEAVSICKRFTDISKLYRCPTLIIDHITKDGDLAGLKELEHVVDICCLATKTAKNEVVAVHFPDDDEVFEVKEMRELYTNKSRYGPAGSEVTTRYIMTPKDAKIPGKLLEVELAEDEDEDDE
jgi:DNA repair protein RadA/Sms